VVQLVGQTGDRRYVPALLALVEEPTHVMTKLEWIHVMHSLAPIEAKPYLRRWSESPNRQLAGTASRARRTSPQS
jgi:hypothetical protein